MPADELVDLIDDHDAVVGVSTVGDCLTEGLLHRAVAVLVIRSSGKFLMQRRSKKDRWHPGLWTISSTGHVKKGESYEAAAARELKEELGLTAPLEKVRKYLLPPLRSEGLTEWEWVAFYIARSDSECTMDPVELEAVEEFSTAELGPLFESGATTPDAVIILRDYVKDPGRRE